MAIRLLKNVDTRGEQPAANQRAEACASLVFRILAETGSGVAVLHTGDTPYLEVPRGEIELARDRLTPAAMDALANYFLSDTALRALRADGSVRSEWRIMPDLPDSRFTIVAALRNHDVWIEVRHTQAQAAPAAPVKPPAFRVDDADNDSLAVPSADELWSR